MNTHAILNFIYELGMLKRLEHEGIRVAGVETPERVADHALRACQIGYLLAAEEAPEAIFDITAMLVWHDIGECRIGDIHKIANRYLEADEEQAVAEQLAPLGDMGKNIHRLWQEFEDRQTPESVIAKDADILEHSVVAKEWLDKGYRLGKLWTEKSSIFIKTPTGQTLVKSINLLDSFAWALGQSVYSHEGKKISVDEHPLIEDKTLKTLNFIFELGQLRRIRHEGLRLSGVIDPDSVASHTMRAAQIGYILAGMENYNNPNEVATLLVWHDIEECRTGDVHKVANRYVKKDGLQAVIDQTTPLGSVGEEIKKLWQRVTERKDQAAIIAKDADYLEQAITAREYIEQAYKAAQNILDNVAKALRTESAKNILNELPNVSPYDWWQGLKKLDI